MHDVYFRLIRAEIDVHYHFAFSRERAGPIRYPGQSAARVSDGLYQPCISSYATSIFYIS